MAFMGLMIAGVFMLIFIIMVIVMIVLLVSAIILKVKGKKKEKRKLTIIGNILLVLSVVVSIPVFYIIGLLVHGALFMKIDLPDGTSKYVYQKNVERMRDISLSGDDKDLDKLKKIMKKNPEIIYYKDANEDGLLYYGLESGNYEVVELAIKYGAKFDDYEKYSSRSESGSMEVYLSDLANRKVTSDDVKILKLMFEKKVYLKSNPIEEDAGSSNVLGSAAWRVLYNDEKVTDVEIEFLQVIVDNGISEDKGFHLYEELPEHGYADDNEKDVEIDDNYFKVLKMVGKI